MSRSPSACTTLWSPTGGRKYLNAAERRRFGEVVRDVPDEERLFCLVLMWSGARVSEVLALTPNSFDLDSELAMFETLKRRRRGVIRQVPLPPAFLNELEPFFALRAEQADRLLADRRIWQWSRTTAWRRVKNVMAIAGIAGGPAMPKGLRHGFGVAAFQSITLHLVQRWLGHASMRTTAIYGDVSGPEERDFAARMWRDL
jgi:integrase/recombinase XerD